MGKCHGWKDGNIGCKFYLRIDVFTIGQEGNYMQTCV